MTSEIRTNSLKSRAGLSTVTFTDSGPMFSGITTFVDNSGFNLGTGSSIFTPASNTLTFGTNSNERLRIHSGGQVTVGTPTSNTSDRFTIVDPGNAFMSLRSDAEADGNSQIIDFAVGTSNRSSSNLVSTITASIPTGAAASGTLKGYLAFSTNSGDNLSERLRIDSSGRVLIGTTSSAYKFCVADNTNAPLVSQLVNTNTGSSTKSIFQIQTGSNRYVNFENDYTGAYIHVVGSGIGTYFSSFDNHIFRNNNGTERLRITSGGKISYNYDGSAVSSIADVDIRSNSGVHIRGVDGNNNNANIYIGGAVANQRKTAIIHDPVGGYCRGDLHFCLENSADLSDVDVTDSKMVIKADGKIGIGVTNPAALTHIYDSTDTSSATEQLRISGGDRTSDSFETGFRFFTQAPSANGNRHIRFTSNANTGLIIQPHETSTGNAAVDRTISLCPSGGRVEIGANGSSYGRLSVSSLDGVQSGGSAIQVMNTAAGSGDGSTTNLILRSVNSAGTQWAMAEYRAQYHKFSNQGTEAFRTVASGDYGSVETLTTKNSYGGYGIVAGGANHVFMGDGGGAGLYNDTNNGWYIYGTKGGDTYLYSNGSPTFRSYVTGDYGCVQTTGTKNGWGGLSISGQYNFMSDGGACGIFNDIDNEWMAYFARNGAFILYHNGVGVLTSDGSGPIIPSGYHLKINAGGWTGEHVGKIQYHSNNFYNQYSSYWIARNASGTNVFTIDSSGNFSSDVRKKENITTVTDALTKVSQLRGVEFNWKEKYGSKQDMGLIAQEVETVFPILISDSPDPEGAEKENEDGTPMKMMNYNGLFAVTVEAIKELKSKIETLEGESLKLKEENAALRERVTNLEGE